MTSPLPGRAAGVSFGARLAAAMRTHGRLCVGLDPHPQLLTDWGLTQDAAGLEVFCDRVLQACIGRVGVLKPQVAFFERYGVAGMQVLSQVQHQARAAGLLVIADAKRGDIGSTMAGYAEAWLNPEGDFGADALTVSPYLGFGSLQPALDAAARHRAGLFVLALTSNPEGQQVQLAQNAQGVTVAGQIAAEAAAASIALGQSHTAAGSAGAEDPRAGAALGSIGLVVGATTAGLAAQHGIDLAAGRMPLLAPGYGAQGAGAEELRAGFGESYAEQVLVNSSRGILSQGPDPDSLTRAIELAKTDLG
ncbi:orotidine 5'-phosphate decarboxylase [Nesterenkonia sp. AN1]|uniref:Orotidine-5'-phosphate decarboxylase n=1 Tax=Nesterenkonia aurantiaca TaxID=1436010 RepID=A0A4R7FXE1_9MICC|nr:MULTISPECIES: orotidine-5'-phosphate decarboxylase [Nesterenkonia]EXF24665.1 orotidine 5'-phosphate decarboxylase [Nesterenkonia sp. AN1]TDS83431.1 orotidine-5'-phosphate decarboxylase [Nesterenkonia aurantiaca]